MNLRDIFVENFAGDLEYHPRRAFLYFSLAVAAFCFWIFSPSNVQFTTVPLVFALGGLALQSSEGLGLSDQELAELSNPANRKRLPSIAAQASQIVQASARARFFFGLFSISAGTSTNHGVTLRYSEYFSSARFFFPIGWAVRRAFSTKELPTPD